MQRKLRQGNLPFQDNTARSANEESPPIEKPGNAWRRSAHVAVARTSIANLTGAQGAIRNLVEVGTGTRSDGRIDSPEKSRLDPNDSGARLLRLPEVMRIASLGRTSIYSLIQQGSFPAPVKVGGASRWASSEVEDWINRLLLTRGRRQLS